MKPNRITKVSLSRLNDYRLCPYQAKLKYIDGLKTPSGEAALDGIAVHEDIENYINGTSMFFKNNTYGGRVPSLLRQLKRDKHKSGESVLCEQRISLNRKWEKVDWDAKDVWVRGAIDLLIFHDNGKKAILFDWKTGKTKDFSELRAFYSALVLSAYPDCTLVEPMIVYTKTGVFEPDPAVGGEVYPRTLLGEYQDRWKGVFSPMEKATDFPPVKSWLCNYCHFRKSNKGVENGGICING